MTFLPRLALHETAQREIGDTYAYLSLRSATIAERSLEDLRHHLAVILHFPDVGRLWRSPHPSIHDVRLLPLAKPFEAFLLFYRPEKQRIVILNVLHGRRDLHRSPTTGTSHPPHAK